MKIFERWKKTTIANKGLVFSSALMAFGTLFYAGAAVVQVCIMRQNARDLSLQTDKLIEAADAEACAARKNAEAAASFALSAKGIETKTGEAATHFQHLAGTAQKTLTESKKSTHLDQRAWLAIKPSPPVVPTVKDGSPSEVTLTATVSIQNTGKTPATDIKGWIQLESIWFVDGQKPNFVYSDDTSKSISVSLIHPNNPVEFMVAKSLFARQADQISRGNSKYDIDIHGFLDYCDVFKEQHQIRFCFTWISGEGFEIPLTSPEYIACQGVGPDRNGMDDINVQTKCSAK
jgi:hypothetical protein